MYLQRILDLTNLLSKKSFFLFGPRSTGKTSLIKHQLNQYTLIINLLRSETYLQLSNKPWELESIILAKQPRNNIVVIDEIQLLPKLLNEVHRLIEEKKIVFFLTGSSARSLKKPG